MNSKLVLDLSAVEAYCRDKPIRRLSLFGSVLSERFSAGSDVDLLVELDYEAGVSLLDLVQYELDLSAIVGRPVDLRTPAELSGYFRDEVLQQAETVYVAQ